MISEPKTHVSIDIVPWCVYLWCVYLKKAPIPIPNMWCFGFPPSTNNKSWTSILPRHKQRPDWAMSSWSHSLDHGSNWRSVVRDLKKGWKLGNPILLRVWSSWKWMTWLMSARACKYLQGVFFSEATEMMVNCWRSHSVREWITSPLPNLLV